MVFYMAFLLVFTVFLFLQQQQTMKPNNILATVCVCLLISAQKSVPINNNIKRERERDICNVEREGCPYLRPYYRRTYVLCLPWLFSDVDKRMDVFDERNQRWFLICWSWWFLLLINDEFHSCLWQQQRLVYLKLDDWIARVDSFLVKKLFFVSLFELSRRGKNLATPRPRPLTNTLRERWNASLSDTSFLRSAQCARNSVNSYWTFFRHCGYRAIYHMYHIYRINSISLEFWKSVTWLILTN